jgi:uncharacterized membrane protein YeiH/ABC-type nitrate/sulfonate/bicarbonate transport system substrate-binding protein
MTRPLLRQASRLLALLGLSMALLLSLSHLRRPSQPLDSQLTPLRLQLHWSHQAQFSGFYMAREMGFFEQEGSAVELQEGGAGIAPLERLARGETDVAVGWLPDALLLRQQGVDIVNVAQLLQRPGLMLACRKDAGVRQPADVRGKRIGSWWRGDELAVAHWLRSLGLGRNDVAIVSQAPDARDLLAGRVDCATAMSYNELTRILQSGTLPSDLLLVHFSENGSGFLEDGLYVRRETLRDPTRRRQLLGLLRGLEHGWRHASRHSEEAMAVTLRYADGADPAHQREMLREILQLMDLETGFGLLDPGTLRRSVDLVAAGTTVPTAIEASARGSWTHKLWREARLDGHPNGPLGPAGRYALAELVASPLFYGLDLLGTAAFGISGFMRALSRRYDLWGCFILTLLPAVGGGTLRDVLIGGMRAPPFLFQDGAYLGIVVAVVGLGSLFSQLPALRGTASPGFGRLLTLTDSVGMATFTILGAKVALEADLNWWWMPLCAALTCAGGGILLDVVSGREPRTFQGEPYEEIAVLGALLLILGFLIADQFETLRWPVWAAMAVSWWFVFLSRVLVVNNGLRSWRPGRGNSSGK